MIATRRASTPEVIEHGRTGWLCEPPEPAAEPHLSAFLEGVAQARGRYRLAQLAARLLDGVPIRSRYGPLLHTRFAIWQFLSSEPSRNPVVQSFPKQGYAK